MEFSASMMCARYENLENEVKLLDSAGIDSYHIDIMDGMFVPNLGMGLQDIQCIRKYTNKPLEVHLMVKNVHAYIEVLKRASINKIFIHPEADLHPFSTLQIIKDMGIEPGVVIDPGTSVETVIELFNVAKSILVMTVTPGFAGQSFLPYVSDKISKLVSIKDKYNLKLYWDGCCKWDKIEKYSKEGIDAFILGTNVLFGHEESYEELIKRARELSK